MISQFHRSRQFLFLALVPASLLASCNSVEEVDHEKGVVDADPPGVARALSLGLEAPSESSNWETSVNCAAALQVTALALGTLAGDSTPEALRGVRAASRQFELLAEQSEEGASAKAAIARRVSESDNDKSGQARLAISCIRRLEGGAYGASSEN